MRLKNDYITQRNRNLLSVYRKITATHHFLTQEEAINHVVNSPADRFYVTPESAKRAIKKIMKGDTLYDLKEHRREMFFEIYERYKQYRELRDWKNESILNICISIVEDPAPKFYIKATSAAKFFKTQSKLDSCRNLKYI